MPDSSAGSAPGGALAQPFGGCPRPPAVGFLACPVAGWRHGRRSGPPTRDRRKGVL